MNVATECARTRRTSGEDNFTHAFTYKCNRDIYPIADRLKSKMMVLRVHRKEIMQCISIFTLVVCAARANQNHGNTL